MSDADAERTRLTEWLAEQDAVCDASIDGAHAHVAIHESALERAKLVRDAQIKLYREIKAKNAAHVAATLDPKPAT